MSHQVDLIDKLDERRHEVPILYLYSLFPSIHQYGTFISFFLMFSIIMAVSLLYH